MIRGTFAPIAALHARIDEDYTFDPKLGRFQPKNALGPAAETLDALHAAKDKAEQEKLYEKMQSGDPNDLFDAAENLGRVWAELAKGALKPAKLLPTYAQLVEQSKPPLPPAEGALALDYAARRATWDALLKRPFLTLRADGPFRLEQAEVVARVRDRLASSGDPPTPCPDPDAPSSSKGSIPAGRSPRRVGKGEQAPTPPPVPEPKSAPESRYGSPGGAPSNSP